MKLQAPLYLLRHGETAWNTERRMQGRKDSPLTERGRTQALAMGRTLKAELARHPGPTAFWRSPLGRVRETLLLAAGEAGLVHDETCHDRRLREMSWGDWDGFNLAEIEARWPGQIALRRDDKWSYRPPNGENYIMAAERAQAALDDIARLAAERPVAVFAHGGIGRVLRGLFLGAPQDEIMGMDQPQDAFYRLYKGAAERIS